MWCSKRVNDVVLCKCYRRDGRKEGWLLAGVNRAYPGFEWKSGCQLLFRFLSLPLELQRLGVRALPKWQRNRKSTVGHFSRLQYNLIQTCNFILLCSPVENNICWRAYIMGNKLSEFKTRDNFVEIILTFGGFGQHLSCIGIL